MVYAPIWKDTYYTSTASSLEYLIQLDGDVIFSGKAYEMPDADGVRININHICENYLQNDLLPLLNSTGDTVTVPEACRTFTLVTPQGNVLETYRFLYCWDYTFNWAGFDSTLSNTICYDWAPGMLRLDTRYINGRVENRKLSYTPNIRCCRYALYYLGLSGWNSFAIQGTAKRVDNITQYQIDRAFNNTTREFEADRYISEIVPTYELNTHYLTDLQAEVLAKNLLSSNKVYMHDLETGKIVPVLIDTKSVIYQTYQTNGKSMAQYTITVKESQTRRRR